MKSTFLCFLVLLSTTLAAQNDRLTPTNLWELDRVYGEQVSPDGKQVFYSQKDYDLSKNSGVAHLMMGTVKEGNFSRISDGETSVYDAQWRPDGKRIGFLSTKSGSMQLWEMNPDGSNVEQVSDFPFDISNWHYSPTMNHISFTYEVKIDESLADKYPDLPEASGRAYDDLMFRHWTQWHDYKYSHVAIASYNGGKVSKDFKDLMEGEANSCPLPPFGGGEQIAWHPDGAKLVYVCKKMTGKEFAKSTNSDLYLVDIASGQTMNITEGMMGYDNDPVFSADGMYLAWLSMARDGFESDKNVVKVREMKSGKVTAVTESVDQTFGHPVWDDDNGTIYTLSPVNATYQIYALSLNKDMSLKESKAITGGRHNINSIALAGKTLVGTMSSMDYPNEIFSWTTDDGDQKQLSQANSELLGQMSMGKVEQRMIPTTDGKEMLTWVIYPLRF